jgi:hypothetical protein
MPSDEGYVKAVITDFIDRRRTKVIKALTGSTPQFLIKA